MTTIGYLLTKNSLELQEWLLLREDGSTATTATAYGQPQTGREELPVFGLESVVEVYIAQGKAYFRQRPACCVFSRWVGNACDDNAAQRIADLAMSR